MRAHGGGGVFRVPFRATRGGVLVGRRLSCLSFRCWFIAFRAENLKFCLVSQIFPPFFVLRGVAWRRAAGDLAVFSHDAVPSIARRIDSAQELVGAAAGGEERPVHSGQHRATQHGGGAAAARERGAGGAP